MKNTISARLGLVVVAVLFLGVIMLSNSATRGLKIDLTENEIYSLSEGTRAVVGQLEEPVHLQLFFSHKASEGIPSIRSYAMRVEELLSEFKEAGNGKIRISVVDPEPFSEEEDLAAGFGLVGAPIDNAGTKFFFGIVGTNPIGDEMVLPFLQPEKEAFLEYDIAKLIYQLTHPEKITIGLISGLPVMGGLPLAAGQPHRAPWAMMHQLGSFFDFEELGADLAAVPDNIDVLMIVHPKEVGDTTQYAIDQFVLAGGRTAIFTDPHADRDVGDALTGGDFRSSNLPVLFAAWGVEQPEERFIADASNAMQVQVSQDRPPVVHLGIHNVMAEQMNHDDIVTDGLESVNIASAGYLLPISDDESLVSNEFEPMTTAVGSTLTPIILSSDNAAPMAIARLGYLPDPSVLFDDFRPTGARYVMAGRINGVVKSAFPDGPPSGSQADAANHLSESQSSIQVVIFPDTDVLSDRLWAEVQAFRDQLMIQPWAHNGTFGINLLDNLSGSNDLISIRSRGVFARPFERVEALRREAEAKFRHQEQELQLRQQETELRLTELQQSSDSSSMTLSPEESALLEQFQDELLLIRKQLREVRHQLDGDIEQLGTRLKIINIAAMPLLVLLFALLQMVFRGRNRRDKAQ